MDDNESVRSINNVKKEALKEGAKEGKKLTEEKDPVKRKAEFRKMLSFVPLLPVAVAANGFKVGMSLSFFLFGLIVCAAVEDRDLRTELLQWTKEQMDAPPFVSEVASTLCGIVNMFTLGIFGKEINNFYNKAEAKKDQKFGYLSEGIINTVNNVKEFGYWVGLHSKGNDGKDAPNSYPKNSPKVESVQKLDNGSERVIKDQAEDTTLEDLEAKYNTAGDSSGRTR